MNRGPARFGELLTEARSHLDLAEQALRTRGTAGEHVVETNQLSTQVEDISAALHTLGVTIGSAGPESDHLAAALDRPAVPFGVTPPADATPGLTRAATLIRAAADLLDSNGPTAPEPGARHTRPNTLVDTQAREGGWSAVAALTESLARVAQHTPATAQLAQQLAAAARNVPGVALPAAMATATAAPALPVAPGTPNELSARIHEVTAIAYRVSQPNPDGPAAGTLRQLAAFALQAHRASAGPDSVARARQWRTVYSSLMAINTPEQPQSRGERVALEHATRLLTTQPSPADLVQARAAADQIAESIAPAIGALGRQSPAYVNISKLPPLIVATTPNLAMRSADNTAVPLRGRDTIQVIAMLTRTRAPANPAQAQQLRVQAAAVGPPVARPPGANPTPARPTRAPTTPNPGIGM